MKPVNALIIMDGYGLRGDTNGNAIAAQGAPNITRLMETYPCVPIGASGMDVGLPDGQMGNSEVGHTNIGAGRVVYQELTRITKSIRDGDFFENDALVKACDSAIRSGGKLHAVGLLSDGGVHSHIDHLVAIIELAKRRGVSGAYVHGLMDGRDVSPTSGIGFVGQLQGELDKMGYGAIATITGRYYAMDRDQRWERVKQGYDAIAEGRGKAEAACAAQAVQQSYDAGTTDEFILPTVIMKDGKPVATVEPGDSVVFFNFRPDRARELTRALIEPDFSDFEREGGYRPVCFITMTQYDATFENVEIAFKPQTLTMTLGEYLAASGKTQLRIAETEKYAHVTFFFNGGLEAPGEGEDRALIPSPKVATYDLQPEMSGPEVAKEAVARVLSGKYDAMVLNFANCDMVGHTAIFDAVVKAVKTVDEGVMDVISAILETGGHAIVTADHGNAEMLVDEETGGPFTAHTTNPVPCIIIGREFEGKTGAALRAEGKLADLAPTLLDLMGLEKPEQMTGESLILAAK